MVLMTSLGGSPQAGRGYGLTQPPLEAVKISPAGHRCSSAGEGGYTQCERADNNTVRADKRRVGTPLCRLCGRLDDLISEPTRAVGATVTAGTVTLIGLPRMAR